MEFLSSAPKLELNAHSGKVDVFCADIFTPRPPLEEMLAFSSWSASAQAQMTAALERANCSVAWACLVVDEVGMLALVAFKHRLQLCDAKPAAERALAALPEQQRRVVEQALRPLDELDYNRISAWRTMQSLRPKRAKPVHVPPQQRAPMSLAAYMEQMSSSEEEDEGEPPLAIQDCAGTTLAARPAPTPWGLWAELAQQTAVVQVASAGKRPDVLTYIRCHREARRVQLIVEKLQAEYDRASFPQVVEVAKGLAEAGSIPGIDGPRSRKSEFLARCREALKIFDPQSEQRSAKDKKADEAKGKAALEARKPDWPEDGCLVCGEQKPAWITTSLSKEPELTLSRCSKCKAPYSFGRTVHGLGDLWPSAKRQRLV